MLRQLIRSESVQRVVTLPRVLSAGIFVKNPISIEWANFQAILRSEWLILSTHFHVGLHGFLIKL